MTATPESEGRSRRQFLTIGLAAMTAGAVGLVTGCSSPPTPAGGQQPAGSSSPTAGGSPGPAEPSQPGSPPAWPGGPAGAQIEDDLAARASLVLAVGKKQLDKTGRQLVTAIRDQHLAHAGALRSADPTDPQSPSSAATPAASTTPSSRPAFGKAVQQLLAAESKAAAAHRSAALSATALAALVWGSLATSAAATAAILKAADLAGDRPAPGVSTIGKVRSRSPMPVVTTVAAEQEVIRQLHALIYGYQLALGRLKGARRDAAQTELRRHRILRDRLTTRLLNRKAEVPIAKAAYVPSTNPRNATTAAKLIRQMETGFQPFCGLWLAAAATPAERTEALNQLGRTTTVARQWGAALSTWPGWA